MSQRIIQWTFTKDWSHDVARIVWKGDDGKEYPTELECLRAEVNYWRDKAIEANRISQ